MSKIEKQVSGKEAFGVTIGSLKEAQALVEKQKARIEELEAALEKERAVVDWYADRDSFKSDELNWIGKRARQRIKERR